MSATLICTVLINYAVPFPKQSSSLVNFLPTQCQLGGGRLASHSGNSPPLRGEFCTHTERIKLYQSVSNCINIPYQYRINTVTIKPYQCSSLLQLSASGRALDGPMCASASISASEAPPIGEDAELLLVGWLTWPSCDLRLGEHCRHAFHARLQACGRSHRLHRHRNDLHRRVLDGCQRVCR